MNTMKRCTRCGETKELSEFHVRRINNGKFKPRPNAACKVCACAMVAKWRAVHMNDDVRKRHNVAATAKRQRVRDAVFSAYGGYRCVCCGETERAFLTLDHVENDGAKWRRETLGSRSMAGYRTYAWLFRHSFPPGYQVLCMNCNHGKRMNHGVCPHQERCNDHPLVGVGASAPKRIASDERRVG
jgi:hypothetical protein